MTNPVSGLVYLAQGVRLLRTPGIRRYALMPLLISFLVYALAIWWLLGAFDGWLSDFSLFRRFSDYRVVQSLTTIIKYVLLTLTIIAAIYSFSILANLIGAPFNSLLAERIEQHLRTTRSAEPLEYTPFSWRVIIASLPRTIGAELRKLLYLLVWIIPIGILFLIPVINLVAPVVLMLFGAWMYAIEYFDYPMGNHGRFFREVRAAARQRRLLSLSFGTGVALLALIPVINLFTMPVSVAGATALWFDHYREDR